MIKDMYKVMGRISEIKKRFGLVKPNAMLNANKNMDKNKYEKVLKSQLVEKKNTIHKDENRVDYINRIADYYSNKNKIPSSLVKAVIDVESKYNPNAVSRKGAKGLMQLMPSVIKDMNVKDPFLPDDNIRGGVGLLKKLLEGYNWDYKKALSAYNAGKHAVDNNGAMTKYRETKEYVNKVIKSYLQNSNEQIKGE
ncbi:lytic transglycosylase domain-containing protein [Spirochaetota bacterium]